MDGKISYEEAKERNKKLIDISKEIKNSLLSEKLGTIVEVLVESFDGKYFKGHTRDFVEAFIECEKDTNGDFFNCENRTMYSEGDIVTVVPVSIHNDGIICRKS